MQSRPSPLEMVRGGPSIVGLGEIDLGTRVYTGYCFLHF